MRKELNVSLSTRVFRTSYLVSHSVDFVLVAAVAQVAADFLSSALFSQASRFLHSILVNIPQNQHRVKSGKLLSHEAANPTACACDQHHLTRYVLLLDGHKEVYEGFHIVPDGEQEDLNCFHEEIHHHSGKKRGNFREKVTTRQTHSNKVKVCACGLGCTRAARVIWRVLMLMHPQVLLPRVI